MVAARRCTNAACPVPPEEQKFYGHNRRCTVCYNAQRRAKRDERTAPLHLTGERTLKNRQNFRYRYGAGTRRVTISLTQRTVTYADEDVQTVTALDSLKRLTVEMIVQFYESRGYQEVRRTKAVIVYEKRAVVKSMERAA